MSAELTALLVHKIQAEGPITFAEFMHVALYHPDFGYYSSGPERSGWEGHFITSPQLDPAFGELWARAVQNLWIDCGRPATFDLVEIGPGEGGFAAALLDAIDDEGFKVALRLTLIERVPALRMRQQELLAKWQDIEWVADLSQAPKSNHGCLMANEVLDNQPVHLIEGSVDGFHELFVTADGPNLVLETRAPSAAARDFIDRHGLVPVESQRLELSPSAEAMARQAAEKVEVGAVVFIDYGAAAEDLAKRPEGSLVCYSAGGTDADPLARPGEKDLTVFANWTIVERCLRESGCWVVGPFSQADVLRSAGAADLDARLKRQHDEALTGKRGRDALRAISRRQALGALLDRGGLGGLQVMAGLKGLSDSTFPLVRSQE